MITLIAEKPSFGRELARMTGCSIRKDGYIEGGVLNGEPCRVTWSFGHLVELTQDSESEALHWQLKNLPVIPKAFHYEPIKGKNKKPDPAYVKQLKVIEQLFATSDSIINCGDAGREGEVIQRSIYEYVCERNPRCRKPVRRLWISSTTDSAIRQGLASLLPSSEYDSLYRAGHARTVADWLVGVNATEALTLTVKSQMGQGNKVYSLGRVQTPILALVCSRYLENKNFVSKPFWTVKLHTGYKGQPFIIISDNRYESAEQAESIRRRCERMTIIVKSINEEERTVKAPLLYDITELQRVAARKYDLNPDETLAIVQRLYENKLVTYPRTGSQFIGKDVYKTIPERLRQLSTNSTSAEMRAAAASLAAGINGPLGTNSVNDGKVTDHHALLIETTRPGEMTANEQRIYNLIAQRMLEAFSPDCQTLVTSCRFECAGIGFHVSSTTITEPGWKDVVPKEDKKKPEQTDSDAESLPEQTLPPLNEGQLLKVNKAESVQGATKPKPLYTMDSLMNAIKHAGKEAEDNDIKAALKDIGIGTPATRAEIIKNLMVNRMYIKKSGGKVVPTETGMEIYDKVKDMAIANVSMTGRWEIALNMIADGDTQITDQFTSKIEQYTGQLVRQILELKVDGLEKIAEAENIRCPKCGSIIKVWDNNARCTNAECGLYMNRTAFGKKLSIPIIKQLMEVGQTGYIKNLTSKSGKVFNAKLKISFIEKDGRHYANVEPVFDDVKPVGHNEDKREPAYRNNSYKEKGYQQTGRKVKLAGSHPKPFIKKEDDWDAAALKRKRK